MFAVGDRVRVTSVGAYCENYAGTFLGRFGTGEPIQYLVRFDEPNTDLFAGIEPNEYESFCNDQLELIVTP